MALRSAGRLAVRLSRLAASRAERPSAIRRATDGEGQDELCRQRPHLGARRVWRDVLAEGAGCGLHKIERLMRANAFRARPRRRGLPKDDGQRSPIVAPNVLDRQFAAERPNPKWIADFTYVWTAEGWLYVAAVIDLFSPRVVGWSMKAEMTAQLVTDALMMAIWLHRAILQHSAQTLDHRVSQPGCVRKEGRISLTACPRNPQQAKRRERSDHQVANRRDCVKIAPGARVAPRTNS